MKFRRLPIVLSLGVLGGTTTTSTTTTITVAQAFTTQTAPKITIPTSSSSSSISNNLSSYTIRSHSLRTGNVLYSSSASSTSNGSSKTTWEEDDDDNDEDEHDDDEIVDDDENSSMTAGEEDEEDLMNEFESWSKALNAAVKALEKKRNSLEQELEKAKGIEGTVARAQLLVSNLYMFPKGVTSANVQDWENDGQDVVLELNTNKYNSASEEADALFAKARKLKRGSQVVKDLLETTDLGWDLLSDAKADLDSALIGENEIDKGRLAVVQDRLIRSSRTTNFQAPSSDDGDASKGSQKRKQKQNKRGSKAEIGTPASNIRKLISPGGCIVLVGRNRRGNEHLSLTVARGNDIWMHSRGCPGAHVVIQNRRGSPKPTDACLQFCADLAIFYSDLRNEVRAEVTAAEPKHIQKPRGAPLGAVKVREEWKTFVGRPDMVPEMLKEARDQSGQSNYEYRTVDKAKHRRKNKQVATEERAKQRRKSNK